MSNIALSVENLGKCCRIGLAAKKPQNLCEAMGAFVVDPF
jgi:hypothetical protein